MVRMRRVQSCLLALFVAIPAHAQDRPIGFLTTSKNIACQFFTDSGQGALRYEIMSMDARPRGPPIVSSTGATPSR